MAASAANEFGGAALRGGVEVGESEREALAAVFGDEQMLALAIVCGAMAQHFDESFGGEDALLGGFAMQLIRGSSDA
jgi:hypothetical protein